MFEVYDKIIIWEFWVRCQWSLFSSVHVVNRIADLLDTYPTQLSNFDFEMLNCRMMKVSIIFCYTTYLGNSLSRALILKEALHLRPSIWTKFRALLLSFNSSIWSDCIYYDFKKAFGVSKGPEWKFVESDVFCIVFIFCPRVLIQDTGSSLGRVVAVSLLLLGVLYAKLISCSKCLCEVSGFFSNDGAGETLGNKICLNQVGSCRLWIMWIFCPVSRDLKLVSDQYNCYYITCSTV